ncbi:MAG: DUF1801 domain-containing protein [Rhodoluna sp.]
MRVEESLGTIKDIFDKASPTSLPLIKAAHEYILELDPEAVIVPRAGEKSLSYGFGAKKMSDAYCYLIPFKEHVNFGFFHGTTIDADGILEGTGINLRHIKIKTLADLKNPKLKKLLKVAIKDRKANS